MFEMVSANEIIM